ncbi:MAG: hypothetical protein R3B96_17415 [Pirellulaceae bacterium]
MANFFFLHLPIDLQANDGSGRFASLPLADQGVTFVSITSDSAYDTPVVLAAYAGPRLEFARPILAHVGGRSAADAASRKRILSGIRRWRGS